jgi:transposase-like protein
MRSHGGDPRKIVTDKLRSYGVAHRELITGYFAAREFNLSKPSAYMTGSVVTVDGGLELSIV